MASVTAENSVFAWLRSAFASNRNIQEFRMEGRNWVMNHGGTHVVVAKKADAMREPKEI